MARSLLTVSKLEKLDMHYDETGDVLYISFGPPIPVSDSRVLNNDEVVRFKGERIRWNNGSELQKETEAGLS